ncbi:MAG: type II secretion system protein GspL [Comamonas sp.]
MTLLIALPAALPDGRLPDGYRYAITSDGLTLSGQGTAPLALLPRVPGEIVALLPSTALSWHAVRLPHVTRGTGPARLRAILDGLLEEHLLDDPARLHLALEAGRHIGQPAGHPAWVACCDKAWLTQQLQHLEQHGLRVTRLLPCNRPLPAHGFDHAGGIEATRVLLTGSIEQPLLEIASASGLWVLPVRSAEETAQALALAQLDGRPATTAPPSATRLETVHATAASEAPPALAPAGPLFQTEPAVAPLAEKWLPQAAELRTVEQRWLERLAGDDDLAQFDLRLNSRSHAARRALKIASLLWHAPQWRPARIGLAVLVAAQLIGLNAWAWTLQRQVRHGQQAVEATLKQAFPQVGVVLDAPLQMSRELAALRRQAGQTTDQDLEALLGALAVALPPAQRLQHIAYNTGELHFGGQAMSAEELADTQERLAPAGLLLQPSGTHQWTLSQRPPAAGLSRTAGISR